MPDTVIRLFDVVKRYPRFTLRDVNLEITSGATLGRTSHSNVPRRSCGGRPG